MKHLTDWARSSRCMSFVLPLVWWELQDYVLGFLGYYLWITKIEGIRSKSKHTVRYPVLASTMRSVLHRGATRLKETGSSNRRINGHLSRRDDSIPPCSEELVNIGHRASGR
ncbi:hypothetical protein TNCV_2296891 [Trichonephila clavipes]|nr:hypothetical protein TNCV_2296891 [Trichonephila clavipes]